MSNSDLSSRKRKLLDLFAKGLLTEAELEAALQSELASSSVVVTPAIAEAASFSGGHTVVRRPASREPQRGEVLGGLFELVELIGRGAMGVVWKARDLSGHRHVCVKLLPPEVQDDDVELARVRGMFEKVHALQHEHLCPLYLMGNDPQYRAFLVMKLIEGVTLSSYWQKIDTALGSSTVDRATRLLRPIAAALDYVHRQNLVHRDIKPANVLVSLDGQNVQVVDLGLAAEIRSSLSRVSRSQRDIAGTAPYMAPEQWRGGMLDGRADQYALANIAYLLLAGRLPFDCPNDVAWMHCALNESIGEIPSVSESVNAAMQRGLAKSPEQRFPNCLDFVTALATQPVVVIPVTRPGSPGQGVQAKREAIDSPEIVAAVSAEATLSNVAPAVEMKGGKVSVVKPFEQPLVTSSNAVAAVAGKTRLGQGTRAGEIRSVRLQHLHIPLCWCPPGQFLMGSSEYERSRQKVETQVDVSLTDGFWIGQTAVIQEMYEVVMHSNPSAFRGNRRPVEQVSWEEANQFCQQLTTYWTQFGVLPEGWRVSLPTEAQREYACRAGSMSAYSFGDDPDDLSHHAWTKSNSQGTTHEVAQKRPNPWGLYDCHGNVWEWCADWWSDVLPGGLNPTGPAVGQQRSIRGGGFNSSAPGCRSASRVERKPEERFNYLGFRIVWVQE